MQHYDITREILDDLRDKAVRLRVDPPLDGPQLAELSYSIEQLVAIVESCPTEDDGEDNDEDDSDEELEPEKGSETDDDVTEE